MPAVANAIATACLIAFFFVGGWLVPIDPSFFQSSTSVLILLLTTDWLDPFLSGMLFLLSYNFLFRRFAIEVFVVRVRVGTGRVNDAVAMIRRRIE
ncbi:MAG TPA: hypothetical protein VIK56_11865 [Rhodoferax sp.]